MVAGVAARVHKHGYAGSQTRNCGKLIFKSLNNLTREGCRYHKYKQPNNTVFGELKNTCFEVFVLRRMKQSHLFKVLGVLFFNDVNDVVNGDNADKPFFIVNNGNRQKVVFSCYGGDSLLVVKRIDAYQLVVVVHYIFDKSVVT